MRAELIIEGRQNEASGRRNLQPAADLMHFLKFQFFHNAEIFGFTNKVRTHGCWQLPSGSMLMLVMALAASATAMDRRVGKSSPPLAWRMSAGDNSCTLRSDVYIMIKGFWLINPAGFPADYFHSQVKPLHSTMAGVVLK